MIPSRNFPLATFYHHSILLITNNLSFRWTYPRVPIGLSNRFVSPRKLTYRIRKMMTNNSEWKNRSIGPLKLEFVHVQINFIHQFRWYYRWFPIAPIRKQITQHFPKSIYREIYSPWNSGPDNFYSNSVFPPFSIMILNLYLHQKKVLLNVSILSIFWLILKTLDHNANLH